MAKKILMVDDDIDFTDLVKSRLEETGRYRVQVENQGLRALAAAKSFKPDLILLDVMIPDMDGPQVAEEIRAEESLSNIPIVFLTSMVSKQEVQSGGGSIGGQHFIAKPVLPNEIITTLQRILGA